MDAGKIFREREGEADEQGKRVCVSHEVDFHVSREKICLFMESNAANHEIGVTGINHAPITGRNYILHACG